MGNGRSPHFRAGVVIVVRSAGRVLAFERGDVPGAWQYPQGGIERGETPHDAAWRELQEETGLGPDLVQLVGELDEWITYEYPEQRTDARLGQAQRWFLFEPLAGVGGLVPVPDGREFVAWRWADPDAVAAEVVSFRRAAYRRALSWIVAS